MNQDSGSRINRIGEADEGRRGGDTVTVYGLAPLLEEEDVLPAYLALDVVAGTVTFVAEILVAGDEWVLTLRGERGQVVGPTFFETQASAILGAMVGALNEVERRSA